MDQMFDKRIWINRTMNFLENNQEKINWKYLSGNPNAIHLLEKNPDKICLLLNWHMETKNSLSPIHLTLSIYNYAGYISVFEVDHI